MNNNLLTVMALAVTIFSATARADDSAQPHSSVHADSHGPIGVVGEHIHSKGEWMLSYRFMAMNMQGNLKGSGSIDPDTIVTTEPNRFFGMPGMPPTLRIVPLDMTMDMQMLGMMYAPSDRVTGWLSYLFKPAVSGSVRLAYYDRGRISGLDPNDRRSRTNSRPGPSGSDSS